MALTIGEEIFKAFSRFFLNPLVYWIILLIFISSRDRIKKEHFYFKTKIASLFDETKQTFKVTWIASCLLMILTLGIGVVFTYEMIIFLMIFTFLLSIMYRYATLSASYALGLTYLLLFFLPKHSKMIEQITPLTMTSLPLLIGVLLCFEAWMFLQMKQNDFYQTIVRSRRGLWYGLHHLRRLAIVPVITLVPKGPFTSFGDFWPFFTIADESYTIFIFPVLVGFHHVVAGELPFNAAKKIGWQILSLAFFVIIFSLLSIQFLGLSFIAVILAIVGRIFIQWQYFQKDTKRPPLFIEGDDDVRILGIVQGSPAEKLGFKIGEIIKTFNDERIRSTKRLEQLIELNRGLGTYRVIGEDHQVRLIDNDSYQGSFKDFGILLTAKPKHLKTKYPSPTNRE